MAAGGGLRDEAFEREGGHGCCASGRLADDLRCLAINGTTVSQDCHFYQHPLRGPKRTPNVSPSHVFNAISPDANRLSDDRPVTGMKRFYGFTTRRCAMSVVGACHAARSNGWHARCYVFSLVDATPTNGI
jgi:hypothetical protein